VNALSNIPGREQGVIGEIADSLHLDPTDAPLMRTAVERMDGYIAEGQTMIDDNWPVVPQGGADVLSFMQAKTLTSSNASLEVAGVKFGASSKGFSLDFDPKKADIPLGDLPKPPSLPSIGGFKLVGDWNIDLAKREATIKASLQLPSFITSAGVQIQNSVTLRATPTQLIVDDVSIGPISVDLASLGIDDFKISYDRANDEWTGQGRVCIGDGACLDMVPPNGEIKIKNGGLEFAGATVEFPLPGIPLFAGIHLERLGFGIGLNPTRLTGNGRISVVDVAKLDGRLVLAFPSAAAPFILRADEVGGGFPANLYGTAFTRATIGATAGVSVSIPDLGDIALGNGYFLFEAPNYIALGGGVDVDVLGVIDVGGEVSGAANLRDETVNLHANGHACLELIRKVCADAVINLSRAPNSGGGAGGCLGLGPVHVGGGIQWAHPTKPLIWPFDGCKWSPFKVDVRADAAADTTQQTVRVARGQPNPAIKLYGNGAAPLVHVAGPGGQALDSTDTGLDYTPDGAIRILRYQGPSESFTVVGFERARPGTYTITALPGSVPFTSVERATDPPAAKVKARVTGQGDTRELTYQVRERPGQVVRFSEIGEGGTSRVIGKVAGGGHGTIRFSPAPGRGRRSIEAQISLQGLPAERITVAHFRPPPARLPRPRGLLVRRHKGTLSVRWRRVGGAKRYELAVTSRTGFQRFIESRSTRAKAKRIPLTAHGVVTVRAIDQMRESLTTAARFTQLASPQRKLTNLGRCTVRRRTISCRGHKPGKHVSHGRRH
jgi:hypothetical protein